MKKFRFFTGTDFEAVLAADGFRIVPAAGGRRGWCGKLLSGKGFPRSALVCRVGAACREHPAALPETGRRIALFLTVL